jgi:hypothetical protein
MINAKIWNFVQAPWQKKAGPSLEAQYVRK